MLSSLGALIDILTGITALASGIGYLWLWHKHRFWLPRYAHFLAAGATLVAALGLWATRPADGGVGRVALVVPLMPLLVYFFVVFLGGAEEARKRHEQKQRDG